MRVQGTKRRAWAQIIEFRRGDLAWYSSQARFLKWGTQVRIIGRFVGPTPFGHFLLEFPQSKL